MVKIQPFAVEQWMDAHETTAKYNIAETCSASISLDDLKALSDDKEIQNLFDTSTKLTYGAIRGSDKLRSNIARLYPDSPNSTESLSLENVIVTSGAILANFLGLYTLVNPGDHVVCHYPTYQQLYSVPESLGADVSLWKTGIEDEWELKVDELRALVKPNTKLIIINNPQNPTGKPIPIDTLKAVINIAKERSIYVFCDEVYRPMFHSMEEKEWPPSLLSLGYERSIVTGSMSKAYGLAGIRLGWIASCSRDLIEDFARARDYTTISVSQVDDRIAAFALDATCVSNIIARNTALAKKNLQLLAEFVEQHKSSCDWMCPPAGTTSFVRFSRDGHPVDDVELCERLQEKVGVMFVPGSRSFGPEFKGFVRIGYVCETEVLEAGLTELKRFMEIHFANVPLHS